MSFGFGVGEVCHHLIFVVCVGAPAAVVGRASHAELGMNPF